MSQNCGLNSNACSRNVVLDSVACPSKCEDNQYPEIREEWWRTVSPPCAMSPLINNTNIQNLKQIPMPRVN